MAMAGRNRRTWRRFGAVACLLGLGGAHAQGVDVVLLAGQSNMVGRAVATPTLPGRQPADAQVRYYFDHAHVGNSYADDSGQAFVTLQPWQAGGGTLNFGPEMTLGRGLYGRLGEGRSLAIIKAAVGGATISRWQPGQTDHTRFMNALHSGLDQLREQGLDIRFLGLAWLQGESDMLSPQRADAYPDALAAFLASVRNELDHRYPGQGLDRLPVFLLQPARWDHGSKPGNATPQDIAKVEDAQRRFADHDPHAWFIPTEDLTFGDGLIHFGPEAQMTLGQRLADAILEHLPAPQPQPDTQDDAPAAVAR